VGDDLVFPHQFVAQFMQQLFAAGDEVEIMAVGS
jgi:hypothetical protein